MLFVGCQLFWSKNILTNDKLQHFQLFSSFCLLNWIQKVPTKTGPFSPKQCTAIVSKQKQNRNFFMTLKNKLEKEWYFFDSSCSFWSETQCLFEVVFVLFFCFHQNTQQQTRFSEHSFPNTAQIPQLLCNLIKPSTQLLQQQQHTAANIDSCPPSLLRICSHRFQKT